ETPSGIGCGSTETHDETGPDALPRDVQHAPRDHQSAGGAPRLPEAPRGEGRRGASRRRAPLVPLRRAPDVLLPAATYLCLASAEGLLQRIGPKGIDAATRIVGFFVSTMGVGLIFHGVVDALREYGVVATR